MSDKIMLVTGASSDVGSELIRQTASEYDYIWFHYCSTPDVLDIMKNDFGDKIIPVKADFTDEVSVRKMASDIEESGLYPMHIVHLANPKAQNLQFHKSDWTSYQNHMDVAVRSIVILLKKFIPHMVDNEFGRIVFMLTSYVLDGLPPKYQSPYITSKYALLGLMKSLAVEYAQYGIAVNGVSPDMMETRFVSDIPKHVINMNAEKNPLSRNIEIADVIPAIKYFLLDASQAVTCQNIGITGGVR